MRNQLKIPAALALVALCLPATYAQTTGTATPPPAAQQVAPPQPAPNRPLPRRGMMGGMMMGGGRGMMRARGRAMTLRMRMRGRPSAAGAGPELLRVVNSPELRQQLGITAEQAANIREKTTAFLKDGIESRATLQIAQLDLRNLMAAETPDRAAIDAALEKISALRLAQAKAAVNFRLDMRSALTPDQRQKLLEMRGGFLRGGPGLVGPRIILRRQGSGPAPPQPPTQP